ncbi:MAG: hypothetical protein ACPGWR_30165 [Ardenticatenaceae bacterium]
MIQINVMGLKHALEMKDSRLYSNQEMASHTGVSGYTVNNLVRSKAAILDIRTFSKLVHYFQRKGLTISVGDFFRWEDEELVSNIGSLIVRLNPISTYSLIAEETAIPLSRLRNLGRGNIKRIYLSDLAALLEFFRERKVEIKLGDLLREVKTGSRLDENDYSGEKVVEVLDRKRHDVVPKPVPVKEEYDHSIRKRTAKAYGQQSQPNVYVPTIFTNIMTLKHLLIILKRREYLNRDICKKTGLDHKAVSNLIRGDVASFYLSTMGRLVYYFQSEGLAIEVGDFFRWEAKELVLNIGSLMARLDPIPTYEEVHNETGIFFSRIENLVRGNVKRIYLHDLAALLLFFRKRGLSIKLGDLLREEGAQPRMFSLSVEEKVRLAEERKALEISRNMVEIGMDVAQIATVTGLNLEQIKVLA